MPTKTMTKYGRIRWDDLAILEQIIDEAHCWHCDCDGLVQFRRVHLFRANLFLIPGCPASLQLVLR